MTSRASFPPSKRGLDGRLIGSPARLVGRWQGLSFLGLAFTLAGCGSARMTIKEPGGLELPIVVEHEPCDISRGHGIDVNGDGRPDVVRVEVSGREVCRMVDLNFDGRPDAFIYFDDQGQVRRRESDFDRDGRIDEVATYAGGIVVRKDRDTNLDGKFDTWDFYENGKLVRRLRDTGGAGQVSQWWAFPNPDKPECAVIQSDWNGDGRPDEDDVLDTCKDAYEARAPAPAPESEPAAKGGSGGDGDAAAIEPAPNASAEKEESP